MLTFAHIDQGVIEGGNLGRLPRVGEEQGEAYELAVCERKVGIVD